jgi:hypothetical protein
MPLIYDKEFGELVNVCIDCEDGPCSTFNDRCMRCHDAALSRRCAVADRAGGGVL